MTATPALTTRREQILATAAELFAQRGFHGVSVSDLGTACGISGPALYKHFASKDAVLAEMLVSISEQLLAVGRERVAAAADARAAVLALVDWHVDFALGQQALIVVQDRDWSSLPDDAREQVRTLQREYVDLWAAQLRLVDPALGRDAARASAHAAFGLINSTPHSGKLPGRVDARAPGRHGRARPARLTLLVRAGGRPGRRRRRRAARASARPGRPRRPRCRARRPRGRRPGSRPAVRACSRASRSSRGSPRRWSSTSGSASTSQATWDSTARACGHGSSQPTQVQVASSSVPNGSSSTPGLVGVLDQRVRQVAGQQRADPARLGGHDLDQRGQALGVEDRQPAVDGEQAVLVVRRRRPSGPR